MRVLPCIPKHLPGFVIHTLKIFSSELFDHFVGGFFRFAQLGEFVDQVVSSEL
jgi:hypothetical protein